MNKITIETIRKSTRRAPEGFLPNSQTIAEVIGLNYNDLLDEINGLIKNECGIAALLSGYFVQLCVRVFRFGISVGYHYAQQEKKRDD